MKVLWFTNTSSLYEDNHPTNGGGWIESLEKVVCEIPEINLAVGFFHPTDGSKVTKNGVTYYPILQQRGKRNPARTLLKNWRGDIGNAQLEKLLTIISDFQPDLIHVFGTEGLFSSIQHYTEIPVVIHLQGLMNPIAKHFFAPGLTARNILFDRHFVRQNLLGNSLYFQYKRVKNQAIREKGNLEIARFVMGRTNWDRTIAESFNPSLTYFHIDEILRDPFMNYIPTERVSNPDTLIFTSTISGTSYKGLDLILKTASFLSQRQLNFKWNLVGIHTDNPIYKMFERKTRVSGSSVNIQCLGVKSANELVLLLSETDVFIHPSYIDNSPNSVCEAQLLGLPVIACDTGGLSTLIENEISGLLVPPGDVIELSKRILDFKQNSNHYLQIGKKAREVAMKRHNPKVIKQSVLEAYHQISKH